MTDFFLFVVSKSVRWFLTRYPPQGIRKLIIIMTVLAIGLFVAACVLLMTAYHIGILHQMSTEILVALIQLWLTVIVLLIFVIFTGIITYILGLVAQIISQDPRIKNIF